jgi:prevent-host-death family protein
MDRSVGAFEAKTHFSALLDRAEKGEEITITRRGRPVARIVPVQPAHDVEAARKVVARMRKLAKTTGIKRFDWNEWKKYVNEGRP